MRRKLMMTRLPCFLTSLRSGVVWDQVQHACCLACPHPRSVHGWISLGMIQKTVTVIMTCMVNLGHQFQNFHLHSQQPATTPTYNSYKHNYQQSASMSTQFHYQSSATMSTYSQQSWQGMHYQSSYGGQKMASTVCLSARNGSTSVLMSQSSVSLNF